jgi:glycerol-3-phosphate dehydrogenase
MYVFHPSFITFTHTNPKLVIDAEVRYAVRHEYAITAIDVLSRRTRLSFLNARAALDALPRVIDIMTEELNWSRSERNKQIKNTVNFLIETMGLDEGYVGGYEGGYVKKIKEKVKPVGVVEMTERGICWLRKSFVGLVGLTSLGNNAGLCVAPLAGGGEKLRTLGRARFEAGEVGILKLVFDNHATGEENKSKLSTSLILDIVKQVSGYETITPKELNYVLDETGFKGREALDWEEFLEVCGGLREVSFSPALVNGHRKDRRVIPVEKSGGGV